ncbi:MAG: hypothetical protein WA702_18435 [Bradyrhizobium sp.]|jgi:hypothetical protein|uniref:hypothetical protein n=1 Tax=Bradyrhizobium sp. TaxID=376 RepID=UPI003C7DBE09
MRLLAFIYRVVSNFALLAVTYLSLNYIENYQNRAVLAMTILVYAGMRSATVLRSFQFFARIERLEIEVRRILHALGQVAAGTTSKQVVNEVSVVRQDSEKKAYIDLFFLAAIVILCAAKIVTA